MEMLTECVCLRFVKKLHGKLPFFLGMMPKISNYINFV